MKELVKPNKKEELYQNAEAYCEVYNGSSGTYYTYTIDQYCGPRIGQNLSVYMDDNLDDILF